MSFVVCSKSRYAKEADRAFAPLVNALMVFLLFQSFLRFPRGARSLDFDYAQDDLVGRWFIFEEGAGFPCA